MGDSHYISLTLSDEEDFIQSITTTVQFHLRLIEQLAHLLATDQGNGLFLE